MPFVWAIINAIPHSFIGTPLIYLVQSCRWWKHSISCGEHSGCCSRWSYCGQMLGSGSFVTFLPFCLPPPPPCWRAAHRKYKIWFKQKMTRQLTAAGGRCWLGRGGSCPAAISITPTPTTAPHNPEAHLMALCTLPSFSKILALFIANFLYFCPLVQHWPKK